MPHRIKGPKKYRDERGKGGKDMERPKEFIPSNGISKEIMQRFNAEKKAERERTMTVLKGGKKS